RSYIRRVDAPSDDCRGFRLVGVQAGLIRPSPDMLEAVKMEEDQWLLVDKYAVAVGRNRVIRQVPGREVGAFVLQNGNLFEAARPAVEIFLICEVAVFTAVVAPFEASLAPPAQAGQPVHVAPEAHPPNVIDAVYLVGL